MFSAIVPMREERAFCSVEGLRTGADVNELGRDQVDEDELDEFQERRGVALEGVVERRQHTRYAVDAWAEVLVKDGTMLFRGRVLDVSVGGCYIETEARLKLAPGTLVEMVFRVGDAVFRCEAMSRMVRTRGAGFLFSSMDAKMQWELEKLIGELGGS
jgi:hypothetical protein